MKSFILLLAAILTLVAPWLSAQSPSARSPYSLSPGVLVLRNGQSLSGQIARQGDSYQVLIAEGNEIRIPAREVRLHSGSLEEAYRTQRDSLAVGDLSGRLQLAAWCLSSDMPHRAADQILMVRMQDARHVGLAPVERRLAAFEMTRRAARETQAEADQAASAEPASNPFDISELEDAIARLDPEQVESFAQRVQPLLVNRCGASGCHGSRSKNDFQLLRPSFQTTFTRRFTQRNLVAALGQIDKTAPEQSPLLEYAITLHGGEQAPALVEKRNEQNELLAEWIRGVVGVENSPAKEQAPAPPAQPPQVKPAAKQLLQQQPAGEPRLRDEQVRPAALVENPTTPAESAPIDRHGDPVDPAAFNRQYHGRP